VDRYVISSEVLGSDSHMEVSPTGFTLLPKIPAEAWALSGGLRLDGGLCLNSAMRLAGCLPALLPPEKWTKAMSQLGVVGPVPWSKVMPPDAYRGFVRGLVNSVMGNIDGLPKQYVRDAWTPGGALLGMLRSAKVDMAAWRAVMDGQGDRSNGALESFKPGNGGWVSSVSYDRFGTRTGRLTVESGPNILILRKDHRSILRSNFSDGKICSLDFSALEARILLEEAGVVPGPGDVYGHIAKELFDGKVERDVVKVAVLSELYGASKAMLGAKLGMNGSRLDGFVDSVRSYFKVVQLRRRLADELARSGRIHNRFGRPLFIDGDKVDHLLVNSYAQSTGVDVSLLGFKSVVDSLGSDGIRPLFVLHDALILDVRGDRFDDVERMTSVDVPGFSTKFPMKLEKIYDLHA
jgi:hypothetical protein